MSIELSNTATLNGLYNGESFGSPSASVTAEIVTIDITKSASPTVWAGGELTYSVSVSNRETEHELTNLVLTDILSPNFTTFVDGSVEIDESPPSGNVNYDETSGLLTIELPNIPPSESLVVSFRVTKK